MYLAPHQHLLRKLIKNGAINLLLPYAFTGCTLLLSLHVFRSSSDFTITRKGCACSENGSHPVKVKESCRCVGIRARCCNSQSVKLRTHLHLGMRIICASVLYSYSSIACFHRIRQVALVSDFLRRYKYFIILWGNK